jgi:hypothetical protein
MEAITAPVEYLLWAFTPVGAIVAVVLFALFASGVAGRLLPTMEASSSARRMMRYRRAPASQHERISP